MTTTAILHQTRTYIELRKARGVDSPNRWLELVKFYVKFCSKEKN